jgi:hypothetical protein
MEPAVCPASHIMEAARKRFYAGLGRALRMALALPHGERRVLHLLEGRRGEDGNYGHSENIERTERLVRRESSHRETNWLEDGSR